jgi:predicted nucleic-acid-binding protein
MKAEPFFADTNLFLRYLTNDVPAQSEAVENLLREAADGKRILITNSLVIAEIVWTLESYYSLSREEVQKRILAILNTPGLEVADAEILFQAILWYVEKNVDFIDAYNAAWMSEHKLAAIYTFDQKHFKRLPGISVHVPGDDLKEA